MVRNIIFPTFEPLFQLSIPVMASIPVIQRFSVCSLMPNVKGASCMLSPYIIDLVSMTRMPWLIRKLLCAKSVVAEKQYAFL